MLDHEVLEAVIASTGRGFVASDVFLTFLFQVSLVDTVEMWHSSAVLR